MKETMVMCNVYKLMKDGNSFSKEMKKLKRGEIILSREYVEEKNSVWKQSGLWHEKLEEKTTEAYELGRVQAEQRKEDESVADQLKEVLTDVIKKGTKKMSDNKDELKSLRKTYEEQFKKKPFNGWDVETLKQKMK